MGASRAFVCMSFVLPVMMAGCAAEPAAEGDDGIDVAEEQLAPGVKALPVQYCYFDDYARAEVRLHVTADKIVGYSIVYAKRPGSDWHLGDSSNEHVVRSRGSSTYERQKLWDSDDNAHAGKRIQRNMPDIPRRSGWLEIETVADSSLNGWGNGIQDDPHCVLRFSRGGKKVTVADAWWTAKYPRGGNKRPRQDLPYDGFAR